MNISLTFLVVILILKINIKFYTKKRYWQWGKNLHPNIYKVILPKISFSLLWQINLVFDLVMFFQSRLLFHTQKKLVINDYIKRLNIQSR